MMQGLLVLCLVVLGTSMPSEYDLRSQPQLTKLADYSLRPEGICAGYSWAKELTQAVSNALSFTLDTKITLSAQYLLECTETTDDKCYSSSLADIHRAIDFIRKQGVTTARCYPNRPLNLPSPNCPRHCHNGEPLATPDKAKIIKLTSVQDVFSLYRSNDRAVVLAVFKVDPSFNFYSSFKENLSPSLGEDSVWEYRVGEVLGWKSRQEKLILRVGPGDGWGYGGFIDLPLKKYGHYVAEYYHISTNPETSNIRMEEE